MPKIINSYENAPVACGSYEDKSIYFEDASSIIGAIDMRKVRATVADQIRVVVKGADSEEVTTEELMNEVQKLRDMMRNLHVLERLAK